MSTATMPEKTHQGRNVKRIREILGVKQDALAIDLGLTQQAVSQLEQKETIDPVILEQVAKSLNVSVDAIKNFNEEAAINNIQNNYDSSVVNSQINYQYNPVEKIVELYEALLKSEREKTAMLQKMLDEKNK